MSVFLKIVTAHGVAFENDVDSVILPTVNGDIEILSEHLPLLTILSAGGVVAKGPKYEIIAVSDGFARVHGDHVDVLVEEAVDVKNIKFEDIEKGIERAKIALKEAQESTLPDQDIERLEAKLQYEFAKKLYCKTYN